MVLFMVVSPLDAHGNELTNSMTADELLQHAMSHKHYSSRLELSIEGAQRFPGDSRFKQAINLNARTLLNWSISKQREGLLELAIPGYNQILISNLVDSTIRKEAETNHRTALYTFALSQYHYTDRLSMSIEGYKKYPTDNRFQNAINHSAQALLSWTLVRHREGDYEIAIDRYKHILSAPVLNSSIKGTAEKNIGYAKNNLRPPNMYYDMAMSQVHYTDRLAMSVEGYRLYPEDPIFRKAINNSGRTLLNWTLVKHREGEYELSVDRYTRILSSPALDSALESDTRYYLEYASKNKRTPQQFYDYAIGLTHYTDRIDMFTQGMTLYNEDEKKTGKLQDGINTSANVLLSWANQKHNEKSFELAIDRYEVILANPYISNTIKGNAVERLKTSLYNHALTQRHYTDRLALSIQYKLRYPDDSRFDQAINTSATTLLAWTSQKHQEGQFNLAIDHYNIIINSTGVSSAIVNEARAKLELAKKSTTLDKERIEYTSFNYSLNFMLDKQMGLTNPPPQTDLYRGNVFIHSSLLDVKESGVVAGITANLRLEPNLTSNPLEVPQGTVVNVVGKVQGERWNNSTEWYQIEHKGETRYIHSLLLNITKVATVKSSSNMRQQATANSHSFGIAATNTNFPVVKEVVGTTVGNDGNIWYELSYGEAWRNAPRSNVLDSLNPSNNNRFQHLVLSSSVSVSVDHLTHMVQGKGTLSGKSRAEAFSKGAKDYSVNEVYLIAHAILETGHGTSTLAQGVYVDKTGMPLRDSAGKLLTSSSNLPPDAVKVYNMYGIAAVDRSPLNGGARYAFQQGWTSPEKAIYGGAKWISDNYINNATHKQDTIYKMRWNPQNPGTHQYATDIGWATKQANRMEQLYSIIENHPVVHFNIPKFQ